jgi:hypothetical protein
VLPADQGNGGANEADKTIRALRDENAKRRIREKELEEKLQKIEESQKTESQKQAERVKALEAFESTAKPEIQSLKLRLNVERTARQLGIVDEEAAFRLMDTKAITYGDDGEPNADTVKAALDALTTARPWLKGSQTPPPPPTTPPTRTTNPSNGGTVKLTPEVIAKMSPDEVNARWDEVQAFLRGK